MNGNEVEQRALFGAILSALQIKKNENGAQVKGQQKRWLQFLPSGEDCIIAKSITRSFKDIAAQSYSRDFSLKLLTNVTRQHTDRQARCIFLCM